MRGYIEAVDFDEESAKRDAKNAYLMDLFVEGETRDGIPASTDSLR